MAQYTTLRFQKLLKIGKTEKSEKSSPKFGICCNLRFFWVATPLCFGFHVNVSQVCPAVGDVAAVTGFHYDSKLVLSSIIGVMPSGPEVNVDPLLEISRSGLGRR